MAPELRIGDRPVGEGHPTYVVAEVSGNHDGSLSRARKLVEAAAGAGADAVKLQTYTPDTMTLDADLDAFRIEGGTPWDDRALYDLYAEAQTPWEWHAELFDLAADHGMDAFSSAFDPTAVDFLEELDVPVFKIASFEIVDVPLLTYTAGKGRPMIVSTGMSTLDEIDEAVRTVRDHGDPPLALLWCNSSYPAIPEEMHLRTIPDMRERWDVPIGLSDHTLGSATAVAAVALGASIVEKHITLDRSGPGPDAAFSMEPDDFKRMVEDIRVTEGALGEVRYGPTEREEKSLVFRRSLFVVEDVAAGDELTEDNVRCIRPGTGLHPRHLPDVVGRRAARDIARGTPLAWELVEGAAAGAGSEGPAEVKEAEDVEGPEDAAG